VYRSATGRTAEKDQQELYHTIFGLKIISIDNFHRPSWEQGIQRLGDPGQTEPLTIVG
jgi:hypothetical protein